MGLRGMFEQVLRETNMLLGSTLLGSALLGLVVLLLAFAIALVCVPCAMRRLATFHENLLFSSASSAKQVDDSGFHSDASTSAPTADLADMDSELPEKSQTPDMKKQKTKRKKKPKITHTSDSPTTGLTARHPLPAQELVPQDDIDTSTVWTDVLAKKQRKQLRPEKVQRASKQPWVALSADDAKSLPSLSGYEGAFEEEYSDGDGDYMDICYSQKGQRHCWSRSSKQRRNVKDVRRIEYAMQSRLQQSAAARGILLPTT